MVVRKSAPRSSLVSDEPAAKKRISKPRARFVSEPPVEAKPQSKPASAVPVTPESSTPAKKRKRLSKAFSRPLDKVLMKQAEPVRERFTLLRGEYDQLVRIKKQLANQGVEVKKSDLLRAALGLLSVKSDEEIKALLTVLPSLR